MFKYKFCVSVNKRYIDGVIEAENYNDALIRLSNPNFREDNIVVIIEEKYDKYASEEHMVCELMPTVHDIYEYFNKLEMENERGEYWCYLIEKDGIERVEIKEFDGENDCEIHIANVYWEDDTIVAKDVNGELIYEYVYDEMFESLAEFCYMMLGRIKAYYIDAFYWNLQRVRKINEWSKKRGFDIYRIDFDWIDEEDLKGLC